MRNSKPRAVTLAGLVLAAALVLGPSCRPRAGAERVVSDVDPLRAVIVLCPALDERRETYGLYADSPVLSLWYGDGIVAQHRTFSESWAESRKAWTVS